MTVEQFNILNNHIGYGNPNAEIVFMGLEEGCDLNTIPANYNYRFHYPPHTSGLHDLGDFHIHSGLFELHRWWTTNNNQSTWNLITFIISNLNSLNLNTATLRKHYYRTSLGRNHQNTCLLEYYPLPRPGHSDWNNINTMHGNILNVPGLFHTLDEYLDYCRNLNYERNDRIRNIINGADSKYIFLHGVLEKVGGSVVVREDIMGILPGDWALHSVLITTIGTKDFYLYRNGDKVIIASYFLSTRHFSMNDLIALIHLI